MISGFFCFCSKRRGANIFSLFVHFNGSFIFFRLCLVLNKNQTKGDDIWRFCPTNLNSWQAISPSLTKLALNFHEPFELTSFLDSSSPLAVQISLETKNGLPTSCSEFSLLYFKYIFIVSFLLIFTIHRLLNLSHQYLSKDNQYDELIFIASKSANHTNSSINSPPILKTAPLQDLLRSDDKIRKGGWALLFIWIIVVCYMTKDYWLPNLFDRRHRRRRERRVAIPFVISANSTPPDPCATNESST